MKPDLPDGTHYGASPPTRRDFFSRMVDGLHGTALATLLAGDLLSTNLARGASADPASGVHDLTPKTPHFKARAKSVIFLFMNGGPSQVDTFDPKPALDRYAGKTPTMDLATDLASPEANGGILPSPFKFAQHGKSGLWVSDLLPHTAECVDDLAVIRSMYGEHFNHVQALFLMQTGRTIATKPCLGSWVTYGLGTENQNLPAFVVLDDPKGFPVNGIANWQSSFLPALYQGTRVHSEGAPVLNLEPPSEIPASIVEAERALLSRMDEAHRRARPQEPDLDGRIAGYELAARMQLAASKVLDVSKESTATKELYGLNDPVTESYGKRCLMARRMVESGVRFVQIYMEKIVWDSHSDIVGGHGQCCARTDKPVAGLLKDLKQRGLLDETLVIWGGEFGRMPVAQVSNGAPPGRDHGPSGFSIWMAGGGIKGGTVYGATDELGHKAVEDRVSVQDFHATVLHSLGLNFRDLTYERHGLRERLTEQFPARVVHEVFS